MSRERTEEEEREYRRYLHRLKRRRERRRKVMIARTIVGVAGVLILLLLVGLIRLGVRTVQGGSSQKNKQVEATIKPTEAAPEYSIPEGFEKYAAKLEEMRSEYPQVENILLNLYEYSESMLKLASNNPDALEFVENYPKHKSDIKPSGSVTKEELDSVQWLPADVTLIDKIRKCME